MLKGNINNIIIISHRIPIGSVLYEVENNHATTV